MTMVDNPTKVRTPSYYGMMSVMNKEGGLLFPWQTCKETLSFYFCGTGIMMCKSSYGVPRYRDGELDHTKPNFLLGMRYSDKISFVDRLGWLDDAMAMLGEELDAEIEVSRLGLTEIAVLSLHPSLIQSSPLLSLIMGFARSAAAGIGWSAPHPTNTIEEYIYSVIRVGYSGDKDQFEEAMSNGNMMGLIRKTLPISLFNGLTSWFREGRTSLSVVNSGMVEYSESDYKDRLSLISKDALINHHGTVRLAPIGPGNNYRNWY